MWVYCGDWSGAVLFAVFRSHTRSFCQASWASVQRLLSVRDDEMTWWGSAGSGAATSECGHFTSGPPRQSRGLSGSKHRPYLSKPPLTAGSSGLSLCLTSCGSQIMFVFRGKHGKRQKPLLVIWRISNMGGFTSSSHPDMSNVNGGYCFKLSSNARMMFWHLLCMRGGGTFNTIRYDTTLFKLESNCKLKG